MSFTYMHPADQLVMIMNRIYQYGMTTTSGGNLSIMDNDGDIWITPGSIDKGTLTRKDMICIKPSGEIIGIHKPSVELPFHKKIYETRPDIRAILHAHPPTLVAFSLARKIPMVNLLPGAREILGDVGMAKYEVPGSAILGERIAEEFAKGRRTVLLENHGVVCASEDLFRAFMAFETLDYAGRIEIGAKKIGAPRELTEAQLALDRDRRHCAMDSFIPSRHTSEELEIRRDMCTLIHRAYEQKLFTSTQGTFSHRLSDGSFLITPYRKDRKYLDAGDIVRIKSGMCESGKTPSRSVELHARIYREHPDVGAVIIAKPPATMSFAVTDAVFDSRTIPESYIMLRDVKRLPYETVADDPARISATFHEKTPAVIIDNNAAIVVGTSLLNAFDRLEVLDYSAESIIAARDIGPVVSISGDEVAQINRAFGLKE
ncbi:MAG: class II aldolase/adducin family protein [Christensenellales bacterium]|jgi:L-fuculose-phosphate aldolase